MEQRSENQYFQEYSLFSNGQNHRFNLDRFQQDQNSFPVEFRELLSIEQSENHIQCQEKEEIQIEATKAALKTSDIATGQIIQPSDLSNQNVVFGEVACLRYKTTFQGAKDDTVQLNTNFKTMLVNYFKDLILANELSQSEILHINQFSQRVPSFQSLKELFKKTPENAGIRSLGLRLLSSSECIKKVMVSRCKMRTKIQMVKYIQKVRANILSSGVIKWKDVLRRDQE